MMGSHSLDQTGLKLFVQSGLELAAVLIQPPKCQDYMHASPCPASISLFLLHLNNQLFAISLSSHSHLTKHPG